MSGSFSAGRKAWDCNGAYGIIDFFVTFAKHLYSLSYVTFIGFFLSYELLRYLVSLLMYGWMGLGPFDHI